MYFWVFPAKRKKNSYLPVSAKNAQQIIKAKLSVSSCVPFHLPSVENKLSNILFEFLWQVKWKIPSLIRIEIRRSANKNTSNWKERKKYSSSQLANILARAKICKTKYFIDFSFQCRPNFIEKTVAFLGVYILITMFYSQSIYYHYRPFSVFIVNTQSNIFGLCY